MCRKPMYAYDHAVHHLAMIKIGMKEACPAVRVGKNIGAAPSTVKHWRVGAPSCHTAKRSPHSTFTSFPLLSKALRPSLLTS